MSAKVWRGSKTFAFGIYVIEVDLSTSASWVLDTRCDSHIFTNMERVKDSGEINQRRSGPMSKEMEQNVVILVVRFFF